MRRGLGIFGLAVSLLAGCGGDNKPPTYSVKGTIQFDGKPIESGSIVLDPADGKGNSAQGSILNGSYELQAPPGTKTVRISASRETGQKDEYGEPVSESYIPEKYNAQSTLDRTVKEGEDNTFDFQLEK